MTLLFRGTVDPGATESVTKFSAIDSLLERWIQAPFRVAAKASSAALPSCPPAAQLLSCLEASWHIRVWQGGAGVRSTATVPWAISAAAPSSAAAPLTAQPPASPAPRVSWVQAASLLSTKDQDGQQPSVPRHLAHPDNGTLGLRPAVRSDKSPAGTRRLFLHPEHIFHSPRVNQHSRASGDHGEHLNTKLTTTMVLLGDAC